MRLVTYQAPSGPRAAAVTPDGYVDLAKADPELPVSLKDFVASGPEGHRRAMLGIKGSKPFSTRGVQLLAPIPDPQKVICVGLNYIDHARESGREPPNEPILFSKFPTAVSAAGDAIVLPPVSKEVDYEAELVAVIGRPGRNIGVDEALDHVAGYCCGNDVSARDWQLRKPGGQWLLGKSFDTFAPFGPYLVTADEVGSPDNLRIRMYLNGQLMQDSSTSQLIFSVAYLVHYVSTVCTLCAGDVIFTGTPAGVGVARKPPVFLQPGDTAEVEIEKLGTLRNPVVTAGK